MTEKYLGSCEAFAKKFNLGEGCCSSCHEDQAYGYSDLLEVEVPEGYYMVCCRMLNDHEETNEKEMD